MRQAGKLELDGADEKDPGICAASLSLNRRSLSAHPLV